MKRVFLICLLVLGFALPAAGHGGEKHADIREEGEPAAPAQDLGPPLVSSRDLEQNGKKYKLTFRQLPAKPQFGQEVQLELQVVEQLAEPDPLLGDSVPLEGLDVQTRVLRPTPTEWAEAHAEEEAGFYGTHLTPAAPGAYELEFQYPVEPPLKLSYEFEVPRPLARQRAGYGAFALLGLMVLGTGAYVVSKKGPLKSIAPLWLVGTPLVAGILYWAYSMTPSLPAVAAAPQKAERIQTVTPEGVTIPPDLQKLLGMQVAPVEKTTVTQSLTAPGQISAPDGSHHEVQAPFTARVLSSTLPQVGQDVRAGDPLLEVEEVLTSGDRVALREQQVGLEASRIELETARLEVKQQTAGLRADLGEAQSRLAQRRSELRRAESLFAIKVLAKKELEAARFAVTQAQLEVKGLEQQVRVLSKGPPVPQLPEQVGPQRQSISSPIGGRITSIDVTQGEIVEPTKALFTVVNLSTVWVRARVPESELGKVKDAGKALLRTTAFPGPYDATLVSLGPSVNPETRTASVIFAVDNQAGDLLDGMAAEVEILGLSSEALTIPPSAIMETEGQNRVFVKTADDLFQARTVTVSEIIGKKAVVTSGLAAGDLVVVEGAGTLASELARRGEQ